MSATDSDFFLKSGRLGPEWVAGMLRIGWPPWFGINGRLAPDYAIRSFFLQNQLHAIIISEK